MAKENLTEHEKQKVLEELNDLKKGLLAYKRRKDKYFTMKFTEGQKKSLDALRAKVKDKYRWLKKPISEYGGDLSIKVVGMKWNVFDYSLGSLSMEPARFTALDKAINVVDRAIDRVELISVEIINWRDIDVPPRPEKQAEKVVYSLDLIRLHPKIVEVSMSLFETEHYAQAIFEALKAVNNFVKEKSGKSLDGKALMSKVFSEDKPVIMLNELLTQSDRDEQEGFKFLFMGAMVGIRNPEAHDNVIQTDPYRTLEYLSFASLLMKRVEEGKVILLNKNV